VVAAEPAKVGWARVAAVADAVIVNHGEIDGAAKELAAALQSAGRQRDEVALLARVGDTRAIPAHGVDGIVLAVEGGVPEIRSAIHALAPRTSRGWRGTLRAELELPVPERVLA
jgi:hypothetical protein